MNEKLGQLKPLHWWGILLILQLPVFYYFLSDGLWGWSLGMVVICGTQYAVFQRYHEVLKQLKSAAVDLSEGDLRVRIKRGGSGSEPLFETFNRIGEDVSVTVGALEATSDTLLNVAESVRQNSESAESGAQTQLHEVTEALSMVQHLSETTVQAADLTGATSQTAAEAQHQAEDGCQQVQQLETSLQRANQQLEGSKQHIDTLESESSSIGEVLETISDIADQTNLLALNAAIEAARAGEQGRGFAVVADEVRTLATRTRTATDDIQRKIENLLSSIQLVVKAIGENTQCMNESMGMIAKVTQVFFGLSEKVVAITGQSSQISSLLSEQVQSCQQLNQGLADISQVSEQNVVTTRDTLLSGVAMKNISGEIRSLLHRFATDSRQLAAEDQHREKLIQWGPSLDLNLKEINRQHQTLVYLVNELNHLLQKNYGLASVKRVVQGLIDYTANHFEYEEALFAQFGYEQEEEHVRKHKILVEKVLEFQQRVERGEAVGPELMRFLQDWLTVHIQQEDRAYVECFHRHGIK